MGRLIFEGVVSATQHGAFSILLQTSDSNLSQWSNLASFSSHLGLNIPAEVAGLQGLYQGLRLAKHICLQQITIVSKRSLAGINSPSSSQDPIINHIQAKIHNYLQSNFSAFRMEQISQDDTTYQETFERAEDASVQEHDRYVCYSSEAPRRPSVFTSTCTFQRVAGGQLFWIKYGQTSSFYAAEITQVGQNSVSWVWKDGDTQHTNCTLAHFFNNRNMLLSARDIEICEQSQWSLNFLQWHELGVRPPPVPAANQHDQGWPALTFTGFRNAVDETWWRQTLSNFLDKFDPKQLLIRMHRTDPLLPPQSRRTSASGLFSECIRALTFLLRQHVRTDNATLVVHPNYDKLFALLSSLPILLLRWNSRLTPEGNVKDQKSRCMSFLNGNWLGLFH